MKHDEIKLVYVYNDWAHQRILNACANISHEQYIAPAPHSSYGSLRATLIHTLDSEWRWQLLCQGIPEPTYELSEADLPTFEALTARWQTEQHEMQSLIASLNDDLMDSIVRYTLPNGVIRERVMWHCLLHVVNHGTQHRSESAALLTSYGQSPGDLDFTVFLNQYFNLPPG